MKILYDSQIFDLQKTGGISRYHANLYKGCLNNNIDAQIGLLYSDNIYIKEINENIKPGFTEQEKFLYGLNFPHKKYAYKIYKNCVGPIKSSATLNQKYTDKLIQAGKFDILHPTYYHSLYKKTRILKPIVITIHDMIFESHPEYFQDIRIISNKNEMINNSSAIISISNYTKEQILRFYPKLDESKIKVIHHGISLNIDLNKTKNTQKENFLLFVGDRGGYKNFYRLIRAISLLKSKDFKLICVGKEFNINERLYIKFLNLENQIINVGRITDSELEDLYMKAKAYISPSIIEGFGLPLLEAMKYLTPMIISDIPIYKEIVEDYALYFNPLDENNIAETIDYAFNNEHLLLLNATNALSLIKKYSLENMISETISLYNSII